jgi:hypothetical protein
MGQPQLAVPSVPRVILADLSQGGQIALEMRQQQPARVLCNGMHDDAQELLPDMIPPPTLTSQPVVSAHALRMMTQTESRAARCDYTALLPEFTPHSAAKFLRGVAC